MEVVDKFSGRRRSNVPAPRNPLSRTKWRETMVALALEVHQEHGTKATVAWVLRQALLDDRQIIFSLLADALREKDQEEHFSSCGCPQGKPTPENAERLASKMFQAGISWTPAPSSEGAWGLPRALVRHRDAFERRAFSRRCRHSGAIIFSSAGTSRGVCRLGISSFRGSPAIRRGRMNRLRGGRVKAGVDLRLLHRGRDFPGIVREAERSSWTARACQRLAR